MRKKSPEISLQTLSVLLAVILLNEDIEVVPKPLDLIPVNISSDCAVA